MLEAFREHLAAEGVKIDEAAFTQDLAFITAMIRYEIDLNLWTVEDARRHLITTDPQAQLASRASRKRSGWCWRPGGAPRAATSDSGARW